MSEYYGIVQGGRGQAHRGGGKPSGIRTTAKSWRTEVVVRYWWDKQKKQTMISVIATDTDHRVEQTLFEGPEDTLRVFGKMVRCAEDNERK